MFIKLRWKFSSLAACAVLGASLADNAQAAPPTPQLSSKVRSLVEEIVDPEVELRITKRRSKIVRMKADIFRVAVADPSLVDVVAFGTREVELIGKDTGSTTVTLWMGDENQPQNLSLLVHVSKDDAVEDRRRLEYGELQVMINEMFPNSKIQLVPIADKLIVRGQARDEQEAVQIMSLLRKNFSNPTGQASGQSGALTNQGYAAEPFPDAGSLPEAMLINLVQVPGEKQVMLKVRIAEIKRSAMRELGADFKFNAGDFALSSLLGGADQIVASGMFNKDSFELMIKALSSNGSAKILAEPNLVVMSGRTANFIAGGEFAVPTVVGVDGVGAATTDFKGFGTQVTFTPTVLDKDRIRLQVAPTFSTINSDNSVNGIFGLDTRSVETTVDIREGQVLAIAGLLQEQQRGDISRIPGLGNIPGLNMFFSDKSISRDETELMILVSPELVHPMEPEDAPRLLPGMDVTEPDDIDFFFYGAIEGDPNCHHRSTVWNNDLIRRKIGPKNCNACRQSESYYLYGPHGFSE